MIQRERDWTPDEARFAAFAADRGWILYEHLVPEMEDENGAPIGGYWKLSIRREGRFGTGERYVSFLDVSADTVADDARWHLVLELAEKDHARRAANLRSVR